jgi:hypothetical protein
VKPLLFAVGSLAVLLLSFAAWDRPNSTDPVITVPATTTTTTTTVPAGG